MLRRPIFGDTAVCVRCMECLCVSLFTSFVVAEGKNVVDVELGVVGYVESCDTEARVKNGPVGEIVKTKAKGRTVLRQRLTPKSKKERERRIQTEES